MEDIAMNTSFQTYTTIKRALLHTLPARQGSHQEGYVNTLALLIFGIISSKSVQLPQVAQTLPISGVKNESLITRLKRWITHKNVLHTTMFMPFVHIFLQQLSSTRLTIIIDASTIGRGCIVLMASVVWKKRAIPLAWIVVEGKKGHLSEELHLQLLEELRPLIPAGAEVLILGDGEFDGTSFLAAVQNEQWHFICRTAMNVCITKEGETFRLGSHPLTQGGMMVWNDVRFTHQRYGPVLVIGLWEEGKEKPLYLVSSLKDVSEVREAYRLRFLIETLFSDQKSRGFSIDKSHLSDPERISRLLIATSLSYLAVLHLGVFALQKRWVEQFHRRSRCDISLFQCGLRALAYAIREQLCVPIAFFLSGD